MRDRYQQFERKCAREVIIEDQSINNWIEKIKASDAELMSLYTNPKDNYSIFETERLRKIESIIGEYNLLLTSLSNKNLNLYGTRITHNVPEDMNKIQCKFIESFSIAIFAVEEIRASLGSNTPGMDSLRFKTKSEFLKQLQDERGKNTKYAHSTKSMKVKKDMPKVIFDHLKEDNNLSAELVKEFNLNLCLELIKRVNVKTIGKNYQTMSIRRVWIPKSNGKVRSFGILSLRDRVLQKIIQLALTPVVEYQADSNSFGFREGRSAHQAVSILADSMINHSKLNQPNVRSTPVKVSFEVYKKATGRKFKIRGGLIGGRRKSKREFKEFYYVFSTTKIRGSKITQYIPYYKYLNVGIIDCFNNVSHDSILSLTPIAEKYRFLIKAWLKSTVVGPESMYSKQLERIIIQSGIPQGSIIGPMLCNIVLDGLEPALYKICLNYTHYELNSDQVEFAEKMGMVNLTSKRETNITCVRYADDIIIFGLANKKIFDEIEKALVCFLKFRGLTLSKSDGNVKVFCPGNSFTYLGFQFCFPDYKRETSELNKGRYTRFKYDITSMCNYRSSEYHRSNPYIIIGRDDIKELKQTAIKLFKRSLAKEPLTVIINKQNSLIRGIWDYYSISRESRMQLDSLEPYFYKNM